MYLTRANLVINFGSTGKQCESKIIIILAIESVKTMSMKMESTRMIYKKALFETRKQGKSK